MAHLTQHGSKVLSHKSFSAYVGGFAYIALLLTLAGLVLILGAASEQIEQSAQRDREEQLMFVGNQFRAAIASYYERSPGTKRYPQKLDELLQDNRFSKPIRHLRNLYKDPMTNQADWQLIRGAQGGIVGVNSRSELVPIRTKLDSDLLKAIGNRPVRYYSDWKFIYQPRDGSADFVLQENQNKASTSETNNETGIEPSNEAGSEASNPFGQLSSDSGFMGSNEEQNSPDTRSGPE